MKAGSKNKPFVLTRKNCIPFLKSLRRFMKKAEKNAPFPEYIALPEKYFWFHIFWSNSKWAVRRHGAKRALRLYPTQRQAIAEGKRLARGAQGKAFLHAKDGSVVWCNDYGVGE